MKILIICLLLVSRYCLANDYSLTKPTLKFPMNTTSFSLMNSSDIPQTSYPSDRLHLISDQFYDTFLGTINYEGDTILEVSPLGGAVLSHSNALLLYSGREYMPHHEVNCSQYFRSIGIGSQIRDMSQKVVKKLGIYDYMSAFPKPFISGTQTYSRDDIISAVRKDNLGQNGGIPKMIEVGSPHECKLSDGKPCSNAIITECFDREVIRNVQLAIADQTKERVNFIKQYGCFGSKRGLSTILNEDFLAVISKFNLKECIDHNENASCSCLLDKKDGVQESLFISEDMKKEILMMMAAKKLVYRVADALADMDRVIKVNRLLIAKKRLGKDAQGLEAGKLLQCQRLMKNDDALFSELLASCGTDSRGSEKEKMEIINKVFMRNRIVSSPIKSKNDFIRFFKDYFSQLQKKQIYDVGKGKLSKEQEHRAFSKIEERQLQQIKQLLIKVAKLRQNKNTSQLPNTKALDDAINRNPMFEYSDFAFCIGSSPDDDCYDDLFKELGVNPKDKDFEKQIAQKDIATLRATLFAEALPSYEEMCENAQNQIRNVCKDLVNVSLSDFNQGDVNRAYRALTNNKRFSTDQKDDLVVQREMLKCAIKDSHFSKYLNKKVALSSKDLDVASLFAEDNNLDQIKNRKNRSVMNLDSQLQSIGAESSKFLGSLDNEENKHKEKRLSSLQSKSLTDVLADQYLKQGAEWTNIAADGHNPAGIDPFAPSVMAKQLSAVQLKQLSADADRDVKGLGETLSDKEQRIRNLEQQLRDAEPENSLNSSTKNLELEKMLADLRGEVKSLKGQLQAAKSKQQQISKAQQLQTTVKEKTSFVSSPQPTTDYSSFANTAVSNEDIATDQKGQSATFAPQNGFSSESQNSIGKNVQNDIQGGNGIVPVSGENTSISYSHQGGIGSDIPLFQYKDVEKFLQSQEALYQFLADKGIVQIRKKNGDIEILYPVKENGKIVGVKKVIKKSSHKIAKKKKSLKQKIRIKQKKEAIAKEHQNNKTRSAYYSLLRSYFKKE